LLGKILLDIIDIINCVMQNFSQYPQFVTYYIPIWFGPAFYNRQRPFVTTFQCPPSYIEYGVSNCSNENYITST